MRIQSPFFRIYPLLFAIVIPVTVNLVPPNHALAQEADSTNPVDRLSTSPPAEMGSLLSRTHLFLSNGVITVSDRMDALLGHGEYVDDIPGSQVGVAFVSSIGNKRTLSFKTKISSKIELPRTQKRFNLILHNLRQRYRDDSIITHEDQSEDSFEEPQKSVETPTYSTALRYMLSSGRNLKAHTETGVQMKIPLDPYVHILTKQNNTFSNWEVETSQQAQWVKSSGNSFSFGLKFDRPIPRNFHLRQSNMVNWSQVSEMFDFEQGLSLYQMLSGGKTLTYFFSSQGVSVPALQSKSYAVGLRFRSPFYYPWLTTETTTMVSTLRTNNFIPEPSLSFQLEASFGSN
jgi:hypothetical protein